MNWIKGLVYLIVAFLLMQVLKVGVVKIQGESAFHFATIINILQFLLVAGFVMVWAISKLLVLMKVKAKNALRAAFAIVIVLLVFFEWLTGYLLNHPKHIPQSMLWSFQYYYDRYDTRLIQFQGNASVYDPRLFYRLKPTESFHYVNREFDNAFTTNSLGLRDDEASLAAPAIVSLGDSYALGWGVNQQETYTQLTEHKTGMKALNAGISSYGTARELLMLQQIDTSNLQYLIIQYCSNDRGENRSFINAGYNLNTSSRERYDSLVADEKRRLSYFPGKYFSLVAQNFLKKQANRIIPLFNLKIAREAAFDEEKSHAEAFLKVLSKSGLDFKKVRVIVFVLDPYTRMKNNFLKEVEAAAAQFPYKEQFAGNLRMIDLSGTFQRDDYYLLDLHIRAAGHAKVAEKIMEAMQAP